MPQTMFQGRNKKSARGGFQHENVLGCDSTTRRAEASQVIFKDRAASVWRCLARGMQSTHRVPARCCTQTVEAGQQRAAGKQGCGNKHHRRNHPASLCFQAATNVIFKATVSSSREISSPQNPMKNPYGDTSIPVCCHVAYKYLHDSASIAPTSTLLSHSPPDAAKCRVNPPQTRRWAAVCCSNHMHKAHSSTPNPMKKP